MESAPDRPTLVSSHPALRRGVALARGLRNTLKALFRMLRRRKPKRGPYTVLITGASTGVGLELARLLCEGAHRLVLTARASSLARLAEAGIQPGPRVMVLPLDVTLATDREAAVRAIAARWGGVDVLVNNAGVSFRSVAEHVSEAERIAQLDANFIGPMELIQLVLPHMRAQRFGRIINVSSVGGMTAMPTMSLYSASKFALEGASESLWYEVRPWNISVSLVRPGFINSDGFTKVRFTERGKSAAADPGDPYHAHYANMGELIEGLMTLTFHTPRDVAETIAETIDSRSPPLWVAGTWDAHLFAWMRRLLPSSLYHRLLYAGLPRVWEWGRRAGVRSSPRSSAPREEVAP